MPSIYLVPTEVGKELTEDKCCVYAETERERETSTDTESLSREKE